MFRRARIGSAQRRRARDRERAVAPSRRAAAVSPSPWPAAAPWAAALPCGPARPCFAVGARVAASGRRHARSRARASRGRARRPVAAVPAHASARALPDSAATSGVSIGSGSISSTYSRRTAVSQPACTVTRSTGSLTARALVMTSCAPAAVRSRLIRPNASCGTPSTSRSDAARRETLGGDVLAGSHDHRNDDAQRLPERRLLRDLGQARTASIGSDHDAERTEPRARGAASEGWPTARRSITNRRPGVTALDHRAVNAACRLRDQPFAGFSPSPVLHARFGDERSLN